MPSKEQFWHRRKFQYLLIPSINRLTGPNTLWWRRHVAYILHSESCSHILYLKGALEHPILSTARYPTMHFTIDGCSWGSSSVFWNLKKKTPLILIVGPILWKWKLTWKNCTTTSPFSFHDFQQKSFPIPQENLFFWPNYWLWNIQPAQRSSILIISIFFFSMSSVDTDVCFISTHLPAHIFTVHHQN